VLGNNFSTSTFFAIFGLIKFMCFGITLIGGPAGRADWRAVFPDENRKFSAGWRKWSSQPKNFWGAKVYDFRRITLFCFEKRLYKQKMTLFSKNLGGHGPFGGDPAGCTKGRSGGMRKRTGRAAVKGSPLARPSPQSSMNVQPTGPPCSAAYLL